MCHKGFAEKQQLFFPDFAPWEQFDHLRSAQQLNFLYLLPGGGPRTSTFQVPEVKIAGKENSDGFWEVLKAREYPMRFDGEPEIGGLYKMVGRHPLRLLRHFLLVLEAEKVLNDRVGKGNIESFVRKCREVCGIANYADQVGQISFNQGQVQEGDFNISRI